jgi:colanic acid/amylovoran biosynthesis glycosyltransferase
MPQKKSTLFVLTIDYPYYNGEPFFHRELHYLAEQFEEVIIFNQLAEPGVSQPLFQVEHKNVRIVQAGTKLTLTKKISASVPVLLQSGFTIVNDLLKRRLLQSPLAIKTALIYQIQAYYLTKAIKDFIQKENIDPKSGIWYSYWAIETALTLAKLRKSAYINRAVTRVHNTDIYEERHPNNYLPFRNFIFRFLDAVIPISQHGKEYLFKRYGNSGVKLEFSRLGIPNTEKLPLESQVPLRILSLSAISPVKNLELIIKTLQKWDACKVDWHHIGGGRNDDYSQNVINTITEVFLNHSHVNVHLHGMVPPSEVLNKIRTIRPVVLVNTSTFEGVPVSMMELASLGIPIIGPDSCGIPEIVLDGKNGFLINIEDDSDLKKALIKLIELDKESYEAMCKESTEIQQSRFNEEFNFNEFISLISGEL